MKKVEQETILLVVAVALISAIVGIGKLLQSSETITLRLAVGRAIVTAALGVGAFSLLAWMPDMPPLALLGISVVLASLGESAIERLIVLYAPRNRD